MSEKRSEKCLLFISEINRGRDKWEQNVLMSFKIYSFSCCSESTETEFAEKDCSNLIYILSIFCVRDGPDYQTSLLLSFFHGNRLDMKPALLTKVK